MNDYDHERDQDECLHCYIWEAIRDYTARHPDGCVEDVIRALGDVIGDQLGTDGSYPLRREFLVTLDRRIKKRIAFRLKMKA